jgi:hypothetical protein
MYQTHYECTYHLAEVFLETDQVTQEEKTFIRNCIYRQDLLNLFDVEEFDEKAIQEEIDHLYKKIKHNPDFEYFLEKVSLDHFLPPSEAFVLLFSFDYMYATHLCLSDCLETGKIKQENKNILLLLIYESVEKE